MPKYRSIGEKVFCVGHQCDLKPFRDGNGSKPEHDLLEFNYKGALGHMLAMEEHMAQLGSSKISDSWCIQKHGLMALNHHLTEAIIHLQEVDPEKAKEIQEFQLEFKTFMEAPDLGELRRLRNRFREIIGDPTLQSECPLCKMDYTGTKVKP